MMQYQADALMPPRQRPGSVLVAGMLLFLVAASSLVSLCVTIATMQQQVDEATRIVASSANTSQERDVARTAAEVGAGVQIGISVIIAILFVVLALFVLRGSQGMRITTWVLAGIGVLCSGFGLVGSAVTSSGGFTTSVTDADGNRIDLTSLLPQWQRDLSTTQYVVVLVSLIVIIILLALPAANAWFRKPTLVYPMVPGVPYAMPGYAQYPGQAYPAPGVPAQYPGPVAPPTQTDANWPPAP